MAGGLYNLKADVADVTDIEELTFNAGSALTATSLTHAGATIYLDTAAGSTVTLPAATGTNDVYHFMVSTLATSNSHVVKVANATDVMVGLAFLVDTDTAGTVTGFATTAGSDTVTLNRGTTGSVTRGETITVRDIASGFWAVQVIASNTGSGATPFSAAVN